MFRHKSGSSRGEFLGAVIATALLAGCAGQTAVVPPQTTSAAPSALANVGINAILPDVALPKCKGEKSSKLFATVQSEKMSTKGGTLCVPAFGDWGGSLQYPNLNYSQSFTVTLISSVKAYGSGPWPPNGSQTPIFYLQYQFSGLPGFGANLPKGNPLASSHLAFKKPYTVEIWEYNYGGLWTSIGSCYQVGAKSKYGGALSGVGAPWVNQFYRDKTGVIEIFKGELVTTRC